MFKKRIGYSFAAATILLIFLAGPMLSGAEQPELKFHLGKTPDAVETENVKTKNFSKYFIGFNLAQPLVVGVVSALIDNTVLYLPFHLNAHYAMSDTFGFSGFLLYRYEKDGSYFRTHEIGLAAGPRYSFSRKGVEGLYVTLQLGIGFCFGQEYSADDYFRFDFIITPEIGYLIPMKGGIALTVGLGLQTLVPIVEDGRDYWTWNDLGVFSHYFLPVLNFSIGFN